MKNLLPAILILSALIALFSIFGTPEEAKPTEGWAFYGGNTSPAPGEGEPTAQQQIIVLETTSPVTGDWEVNPMYISWQTIITAGAVVSALALMLGILAKIYKWYLKQEEQDNKIDKLTKHHEDDVHRLKEENCLICFALSACLDGLQQLGANHTVPLAKEKLDKYLNQQAHE